MKYRLLTPDGDIWDYSTLDEAKKTKYIFGGTITEIKEATTMKPITVRELIIALKELKQPNAQVALSSDAEGNGFSLIGNEQFLCQGFMTPELGYGEFEEEQPKGTKPTVVLFGTN